MEHGEEADFGAEVSGIAGDGEQRLGDGLKEEVVDGLLVVESDGGDLLRHREDDVKVLDGEQFGLSLLQPASARFALALGAMPVAAGAVEDVGVLAVVAPFDRSAQ